VSTSSTSRPRASTSRTSNNSSRCSTGSSIRASAGNDGGRIVFEGTPADLVKQRKTLTGKHLAAYVGA
jgi:hypothetical protein